MRSSTFNSDRASSDRGHPDRAVGLELSTEGRLVRGGWSSVFLVACAIGLTVLGLWELHWRRRAVEPSVSDLQASWNVARDRVREGSVVLVGTSKMQSALDPAILRSEWDSRRVLQLALIDRSPLPVLEALAADESFAGTVVVDVAPRIFFDGSGSRERATEEILASHRASLVSPGEWVDARLALRVEDALVLRRPAFSLRRLVERRWTGRTLEPPFARVRLDRFRALDFTRVDLESRRLSQATIVATRGRPASDQELARIIDRVAIASRRLEARGGQVVLTHLPVTGRAKSEEARRFPRQDYWQVLVGGTGVASVHSEDHGALADFDCPDGLHLDRSAAADFSRAFAQVVSRKIDVR